MSTMPLDAVLQVAGGRFEDVSGVSMATDFGDAAAEYQASRQSAGLYDARDRGVIDVTGKDRATWLHNLTTNAVKTLAPGEGNYAFACNIKGRILFDLNILVLADSIRLDVDRRLIAKILAHFNKYTITEDVTLKDRSEEFTRIALLGPKLGEITAPLGAPQAPAMAALGSTVVTLAAKPRLMVRHDFAGVPAVEFHVEASDAPACWQQLMELGRGAGCVPVGRTAINILRIEAGIPWYGPDIDEEVLPAETQQLERAISFHKGCYLGQEVVERMRSRGSLARKLVGLKFSDGSAVTPGAALEVEGKEAGRVTSVCDSYGLHAWIGLGYAKSAFANPGTKFAVAGVSTEGEVCCLPFAIHRTR